jgi:hypothetical protein
MVNTKHHSEAVFRRSLLCAAFVVVALTSVACDKYEPTKHIEGTYRPSQCVTLQGIIPGGWLSRHETIHPTICQPMRVSEIGVYTYGGGWSVPGVQAEVGRLEFADAGVLVELSHLRQTGTFDYRDRGATLGEWTRNNPIKAIMLVLVGLAVAVTIPLRLMARKAEPRRTQLEDNESVDNNESVSADEIVGKTILVIMSMAVGVGIYFLAFCILTWNLFLSIASGIVFSLLYPFIAALAVNLSEAALDWAFHTRTSWHAGTAAFFGAVWPLTLITCIIISIFFGIVNRLFK